MRASIARIHFRVFQLFGHFALPKHRTQAHLRLADLHRHLTQKLGCGLRDDEWTGLAQVLDADGDGTLSYGEIFAGLQEAASPTKLGRQRSKGPRPFGRTTSRTAL